MDVTVKEEGDLYFVLKSVARQLDCDVNNEVHASIINNVTVDILDEYLFVCYQILKEAIHAYNSDEIGLCLPESPMADADMINNDIDAQYYELNHYYSEIRQFVNKHLKKINNFYKKGLTPPFGYKLLAVFMDAIIYSSGNSKYPKIVREIIYK